MKLKDVIIVSLLGVVAFVLSMLSGTVVRMFGAYAVFVHTSIASLLCAPIYFVMCHKIPKHGSIFIYYLLSGIAYSIMGFVPMLFVTIGAGLLGEICIFNKDNFENDIRIGVSYVVSQIIYALHGFFFILVLGVNGLVNTFPNLYTTEKAQKVKDTFMSIKNMSIILSVEILAAILGILLGKFIYNKFFNKNTKKKRILF